jgi:D-xylose transport system substrate-binding protein
MRKHFIPVLLGFFILLQGSCSSDNKKLKIGFLADNFIALRWQKEKKYFTEKAEELGADVLVRSAEEKQGDQLAVAEEMFEQGIDVLVIIAANANSAAAIVRKAHEKNIKVIGYDRLIKNSPLDFYISFDNEAVGSLMAKYLLDIIPEGNYVLINGDKSDNNAVAVYNGIMEVLKPKADNVNIVYSGFMDGWSGKEATFYIEKIINLSGVKIDAIISSYDGLSDGIIEVLKKYNLENDVLVTGQDAELAACARIMVGEQVMTIYKPGKEIAYHCAEIAVKIANHEKLQISDSVFNGRQLVPTLLLAPVVVDKNNIESTIVKDGFWTMDEIQNFKKM